MSTVVWALLDDERTALLGGAPAGQREEVILIDVRASERFVDVVQQLVERRSTLRVLGLGGTAPALLTSCIPPVAP